MPDKAFRNKVIDILSQTGKPSFEEYVRRYNLDTENPAYDYQKAYEAGVVPEKFTALPEDQRLAMMEAMKAGSIKPFNPKSLFILPEEYKTARK